MRRVALGLSLRRVLLGSLATSLLAAAAAPALAAGEKPVSIPAGPLEEALAALSAQTGDQLLFPLVACEAAVPGDDVAGGEVADGAALAHAP